MVLLSSLSGADEVKERFNQDLERSRKKNETKRLCTRRNSVLMMGVAMGECQKYSFVR